MGLSNTSLLVDCNVQHLEPVNHSPSSKGLTAQPCVDEEKVLHCQLSNFLACYYTCMVKQNQKAWVRISKFINNTKGASPMRILVIECLNTDLQMFSIHYFFWIMEKSFRLFASKCIKPQHFLLQGLHHRCFYENEGKNKSKVDSRQES
jgi:hypothetical protein